MATSVRTLQIKYHINILSVDSAFQANVWCIWIHNCPSGSLVCKYLLLFTFFTDLSYFILFYLNNKISICEEESEFKGLL